MARGVIVQTADVRGSSQKKFKARVVVYRSKWFYCILMTMSNRNCSKNQGGSYTPLRRLGSIPGCEASLGAYYNLIIMSNILKRDRVAQNSLPLHQK